MKFIKKMFAKNSRQVISEAVLERIILNSSLSSWLRFIDKGSLNELDRNQFNEAVALGFITNQEKYK